MATKKKELVTKSNVLKKALYYAKLFDGIWSAPLAFLLFAASGFISFHYFGDALISTEYVQYIALAALIMVCGNLVTFLGIRFNFSALQKAVYDKEIKYELNTYLTTWQKVVLYLLLYAFYFAAFLFVLHLLMTVTA